MNITSSFSSLLIGIISFSSAPFAIADEFDSFEGFAETQEAANTDDSSIVRFVDGSTYDIRKEDADRDVRYYELLDTKKAPAILAPTVIGLTATSATIQWITDRPTNGMVYVSTYLPADPITGDTTMFAHFDLSMGHSVDLSNLRPGVNYYYRVESRDETGKTSTILEHSFITPVE